jgi:pSer/pThr/pTyr-binding forkhead associated (FHA) protein
MTILDDGQIILEDKNSRNGTTVGKKKLEPGKEVSVQRGDMITFADTPLVWARIPAAEKLSNYKAVYNIGSNYRNDIILNSQTVSRYHASVRLGKDGKMYIRDNGSRNGTMVNGVKIAANKDERIKKGYNIVCGAEDITEQVAALFPKNGIRNILIAAAGVLAAALIVLGIYFLWPKKVVDNVVDPQQYRPTVVYVRASYHYIIDFEDNPMPGQWDGKLSFNDQIYYQATAFFLDSLGRMGTNRHVAVPWEYVTKEDEDNIRQEIEDRLPRSREDKEINKFLETGLGQTVLKYAYSKSITRDAFIKKVYDICDRIRKSHYTISGALNFITLGYPGNYYTHEDEFQRCNVLKVSDNKDIDLAILQLNNKKTPKEISFLFSPENYFSDRLDPLKDQLYVIGYPAGIIWGMDDKTKSLEPTIRETKCSKEPGRYDFEFQANSVGGSSGSPVFNTKGQLVGILYGGYSIAGGSTKAVHAKFLKNLYEDYINVR